MKRLICLVLSFLLLLLLPSCSPAREDPEAEAPKELSGTVVSSAVRITPEALEIETSTGDKYVFPGNVIEADRGISAAAAAEQLQAQKARGALCPPPGTSLALEFTDAVPKSVACYNHYYLDAEGEKFLYEDLQKTIFIEPTKASATVPIETDMAFALSSVLSPAPHYRIVRIVCRFETQTVEYYIFSSPTAD